MTLDACREFFAEEVRIAAGIDAPAIIRALATVPRERFLGAGPWQLLADTDVRGPQYRSTPDADPRHVYHNVAIAIDPARHLSNGHPGTLASWIQWLAIRTGGRVVHIGCGQGYYSAVLAEAVGPHGHVTAIEIDPELAAQAARNLAPWANVRVEHGDGTALEPGADAILVNAGVTHSLDQWLDALRDDGGAMIVPTATSVGPMLTKGLAVRVERHGGRYQAQCRFLLMIYACAVARDPELNQRIGPALMSWTWQNVRSLRRDRHAPDDTCWLHKDGCCLSTVESTAASSS